MRRPFHHANHNATHRDHRRLGKTLGLDAEARPLKSVGPMVR